MRLGRAAELLFALVRDWPEACQNEGGGVGPKESPIVRGNGAKVKEDTAEF